MRIKGIEMLEEVLSEPSQGVIETIGRLEGDIIVLGAGGKMGPTLARMAKRASEAAGANKRIIAVSRFSSSDEEAKLNAAGIETIRCDLLDREGLEKLPDVQNVVYMAGMKFGSTGKEPLTWAMNSYLAGMVCEKYRSSRIAAFSTGNIYGLTPITSGGSLETDTLRPEGEYAMSCMGRERIFQHFSLSFGTRVALIRLNYAVELRYGVLVDMARRVWNGEAIDVTMGNFNAIWQGDANAMTLMALEKAASPAFVLNVAGPEIMSVRRVAEQFGEMMGKTPCLCGEEASDALISNGQLGHSLFGYPRVSALNMMKWIVDWVMNGGENIGKPTHFETRDGKF